MHTSYTGDDSYLQLVRNMPNLINIPGYPANSTGKAEYVEVFCLFVWGESFSFGFYVKPSFH